MPDRKILEPYLLPERLERLEEVLANRVLSVWLVAEPSCPCLTVGELDVRAFYRVNHI